VAKAYAALGRAPFPGRAGHRPLLGEGAARREEGARRGRRGGRGRALAAPPRVPFSGSSGLRLTAEVGRRARRPGSTATSAATRALAGRLAGGRTVARPSSPTPGRLRCPRRSPGGARIAGPDRNRRPRFRGAARAARGPTNGLDDRARPTWVVGDVFAELAACARERFGLVDLRPAAALAAAGAPEGRARGRAPTKDLNRLGASPRGVERGLPATPSAAAERSNGPALPGRSCSRPRREAGVEVRLLGGRSAPVPNHPVRPRGTPKGELPQRGGGPRSKRASLKAGGGGRGPRC